MMPATIILGREPVSRLLGFPRKTKFYYRVFDILVEVANPDYGLREFTV